LRFFTHATAAIVARPYPRYVVESYGWKQHLWLYENTELTSTETLLHTVCAPAYVVEVIEHLEREHLLPHIIAIGLEECVFNATDKNGRWCDHKSPKPLRAWQK
jgi:hypothetical protein